jgi:AAA domain
MTLLEPDRDQIEIFVEAMFRHCAPEGFVSLRAFPEGDGNGKAFRITPIGLVGGLRFLMEAAEDDARRAACNPKPIVFCPPVATFANKDRAGESDLAEAPALSLELDQKPQASCEVISRLLSPPTLVVRSGGTWTNPTTGEVEDKLHLHWRLTVPARGKDAIAKLKRVRRLATALVGGDPTNVPACHPIRWPGSWHRKGEPRLCTIEIEVSDPDREVDLDTALTILEAVAPPQAKTNDAGRDEYNENDDSPRELGGDDWADLVGGVLVGESLHRSIAVLAMKFLRAGMHDSVAVRFLRALMIQSQAPRDVRWQSRYDDIWRAVKTARDKIGEPEPELPPESEPQPKPKPDPSLLQIRWYGEADTSISRRWLIQSMLPETGVGLISGQWGTYKTFVALDLAVAVLTGETFAGYQVVRRGGTLFIAAEGQSEVAIRLQGAIGNKSPMPRAAFCWAESCPPLLDSASEKILIATAKAAAQRMQAEWSLPLALIMIDTVNAAAGYVRAGDENDAALNGRLIARLNKVAQATGALVLAVDHFGKAVETGTRGSSAKEGNADVVLALIADKEINGTVSNTRMALRKLRAGSAGVELPFSTREIVLSVDQDDRRETTLVIDWGALPEAPTKDGKSAKDDWGRSKAVKLLRRIIMGLLADVGVEVRPWADGPTVRALKVELVKAEFCKGWYAEGDTPKRTRDAKRMAFKRAIDAAVDRRVIVLREVGGEDYVWLATADMPSEFA